MKRTATKSPTPNKVYIGIDPGATGAMAIIYTDGLMNVWDFEQGDCLRWLKRFGQKQELGRMEVKVVLEKVASMPKQGVSSTFKFGTNFGIWIGRLEAYSIPFDFVTSGKWKKKMLDSATKIYMTVSGKTKDPKKIPKGATDLISPEVSGKDHWTFKKKVVDTKTMSLDRARRLFPQIVDKLARKLDHGRAEALLMAEYCRRMDR